MAILFYCFKPYCASKFFRKYFIVVYFVQSKIGLRKSRSYFCHSAWISNSILLVDFHFKFRNLC